MSHPRISNLPDSKNSVEERPKNNDPTIQANEHVDPESHDGYSYEEYFPKNLAAATRVIMIRGRVARRLVREGAISDGIAISNMNRKYHMQTVHKN